MAQDDSFMTQHSSHSSTSDTQEWRYVHVPSESQTELVMTAESHDPNTRSRNSSIVQNNNDGNISDSSQYSRVRAPISAAVTSAVEHEEELRRISPEAFTYLTSRIVANLMQEMSGSQPRNGPIPSAQEDPTAASSASQTGNSPDEKNSLNTTTPHSGGQGPESLHPSPSLSYSQLSQPFPSEATSTSPQQKKSFDADRNGDVSDGSNKKEPVRPKMMPRISTGNDMSSLEKAWGKLFDKQDQPTPRLGEFLRGIAVYLIEEYEPKQSIVITPSKMLRFYEDTLVTKEVYPWRYVFDHHTSSISRLFREFEIEHHLIQEPDRLFERPELPGLTPHGFETWVLLLLRAHPDQEFERLSYIAQHMPINNPDDRSRRYPKELPQRLFVSKADVGTEAKLQSAMITHCAVRFSSRKNSNAEEAPGPRILNNELRRGLPSQAAETHSPASSTGLSNGSAATIIGPSNRHEEVVEEPSTARPLERERKPYVGETGGGRTYVDPESSSATDTAHAAPEPRLVRSSSTNRPSARIDIPRPRDAPVSLYQISPTSYTDGSEMRRHRSNTSHGHDLSTRPGRPPTPPSAHFEAQEARNYRNTVATGHEASTRSGRLRSPSTSHGTSYGHPSEHDVGHQLSSTLSATQAADDSRRMRANLAEYERNRERHLNDRYDPARMAHYDPAQRDAERGRESRQRLQSMSVFDSNSRPCLTQEDHHQRPSKRYSTTTRDGHPIIYSTQAQFPPSAYRDNGRRD